MFDVFEREVLLLRGQVQHAARGVVLGEELQRHVDLAAIFVVLAVFVGQSVPAGNEREACAARSESNASDYFR